MATFPHALGTSELVRRPVSNADLLLAWDAADQLLLECFAEHATGAAKVLVVNDSFGALAVALGDVEVTSWSDSRTAHLATETNLAANGGRTVRFLRSTEQPDAHYDAVLWRVPRSMDLLRWQAHALHSALTPGTKIWAGGMDKHLPDRTLEVLRQMGEVQVLPGKKKAHVFAGLTAVGPAPLVTPSPGFTANDFALEFTSSPNVFGAGRIDSGTRLLAERFDKMPDANRIVDLGCGTGILGLVAQRMQPQATVHFFDESYAAVAATEANYRLNIGDPNDTGAMFFAEDAIPVIPNELYDVVLCNPPFHQGHVVGDGVAWQMFTNARASLRMGGELWIVGNRHLEYHTKLARLYGSVRQLADNPKFVVLAATRDAKPFVPVKRKKKRPTSPRSRPPQS
jgi:23S rRNA (guanine1835-N2)-methyltransferase